MDKLRMQSSNGVEDNIMKIAQLFPDCVTETMDERSGQPKHLIDFEKLKQNLSDSVMSERAERYQFTWPDKSKAILLANSPINATLRPCREDSVDFDNTQNLYIEGDNLDVLKCLKETYLHKVKMIYIDPPYNTGNDFIYEDDFSQSIDFYANNSGQTDTEGNHLVQNFEGNGRFHTDWLNMMYPRLKLAKDYLSNDGAIFISIDDHEQDNLKRICNVIFGEKNFIACVVWQRTYAPISLKKFFSESHEYCLIYAKNKSMFKMHLLPRSEKQNKDYKNPDNDPRGRWKVGNLTVGPAVESQIYPITGPTGKIFYPPKGYCWRFSKEKFEQLRNDNRIWFGLNGNNSPVPKLFLSEVQNGVTPMTLWTFEEAGHGQEATRELRDLMGNAVFTNPKPIRYLKRLLTIGMDVNSIIMDFFSGSATTAHALMELNAQTNQKWKFILVQISEEISKSSNAYKAGYKTICDIGEERIRRAGKKIKKETGANIDYGFRCFKVDSSNMKDIYYRPAEINQDSLGLFEDNIKEDRTPEDLLIQVMLDLGVLLSSKVERTEIAGKKVFSVADGYLIACFDQDVTEDVVTAIAKKHPFYAVFRDSSMADDSVASNFEQIFATYSPETVRKVL